MKRMIAILLVLVLALSVTGAFAKSKQMDTDLPTWTEETVRNYVLDYIEGKEQERLYSYCDLQIRRYMPFENFKSMLVDLEWMTGEFICLGSYSSFVDDEVELKTHVVHLCMEKQDLDLYFTTKNEEDDWEIMALEFVPAEKQIPEDVLLTVDESFSRLDRGYLETEVVIGEEPYVLNGILTIPEVASSVYPCPVCVLIHDDGAFDKNMTMGSTVLFKDMAHVFAEMGIATLRYDKRTYAYPSCEISSIVDEVVEDAVAALRLVSQYDAINQNQIFLLGVGFGGTLVPRIAKEANIPVHGMLIVHGTAVSKLQWDYDHLSSSLSEQEEAVTKNFVRNGAKMKLDDVFSLNIMGKEAFYYWEMLQQDQCRLINNLMIPTCIIQSRSNKTVTREEGLVSYQKALGKKNANITWYECRNVNHLLMKMLNTDAKGNYTYDVEAHLDKLIGMDIANWMLTH